MRIETKEFKIYKFDELSKEVQERVIEKERQNQWEYGIYLDFAIEEITERLNLIGFVDAKIGYSLSYSQGDGVAFYDCDIHKFRILEKLHSDKYIDDNEYRVMKRLAHFTDIELSIDHVWHHYYHWNSHYFNVNFENYNWNYKDYPLIEKYSEILEKAINKLKQDLCHYFESELYQEIENQTSEEYVIEMIEANNYEYLENGEMY